MSSHGLRLWHWALVLVALLGSSAAASVEEVTSEAQFKKILSDYPAVVVDFYSQTCGPCIMMAPIYKEVAKEYDGRLKLRVEPDGDRDDFANVAAFPATGNTAKVYFSIATQTFYRWTGSAYAETYPYAAVRLLADTAVLGLDQPLFYNVAFTEVIFNGQSGRIKPFTFQAPIADIEVSLIEVMPPPGQTSGQGINAPMLSGAEFDEDGDLVFVNAGGSLLDPIEIPSGTLVFTDNGDGTWSVG